MFKRFTSALLVLSSVAVLTACPNEGAGLYAGFRLNAPSASVEATTVDSGDPVTVTLKGSAFSDSQNPNREEFEARLKLGACFTDSPRNIYRGTGLCLMGEQSVASGIRLLNGSSYATKIMNVTLRPGEERTFEHSFAFTMPQAGEVVVIPFLVIDRVEGGRMQGDDVSVTFQ